MLYLKLMDVFMTTWSKEQTNILVFIPDNILR